MPQVPITSRQNRWLKTFRAALRGSGPGAGEPIAVEGPKLVREALAAGLECEALLVSDADEHGELVRLAQQSGMREARILRATEKLFAGVAATESPQGAAALFRQREWQFEDVLRGRADSDGAFPGHSPLILVLAGVQDAGNAGAMVRSAEAFGATGVVAARGSADPWSPKAVRASAGSALWIPILRGIALPVLLAQLRMAQVRILAASPHRQAGAHPIAENNKWNEALALLIGAEGSGVPAEAQCAADDVICVPMTRALESLNAAVAASILLYEIARRRDTLRAPLGGERARPARASGGPHSAAAARGKGAP